MTLIKSISGIRGTIGGATGKGLTPLDMVKFTSAYATLIRRTLQLRTIRSSLDATQESLALWYATWWLAP